MNRKYRAYDARNWQKLLWETRRKRKGSKPVGVKTEGLDAKHESPVP
jgi:hypothetical protein